MHMSLEPDVAPTQLHRCISRRPIYKDGSLSCCKGVGHLEVFSQQFQ